MGKKEKRVHGIKAMHPIAFWILLAGCIAALAYGIYNITIAIWALASVERLLGAGGAFGNLVGGEVSDMIKNMFRIVYGAVLLAFAIFVLIYALVILGLLKNQKGPRSQKYLRTLWIITIIGLIFNVISLLASNWVAISSLAINITLLVGLIMQKNYNPDSPQAPATPAETPENPQ